MKITVFSARQLRIIHRHPHLQKVSAIIAAERPHLAEPHEHTFKLVVGMRCERVDRQHDLLLLHEKMDALVRDRHDMGSMSFEQICIWVRSRIPESCKVIIEERDEGAEIEFSEGE